MVVNGGKGSSHTDEIHKPSICYRMKRKKRVILFMATCKWRKNISNLDTKGVQEVVTWNPVLSERLGSKNSIERRGNGKAFWSQPRDTVLVLCKSVSQKLSVDVQLLCSFWALSPLFLPYIQQACPSPSQTVISDFRSSGPIRFPSKNIPNPNNLYHLCYSISLPGPHFLMPKKI